MERNLLLAAEDSDCLSQRLKAKSQALRNLSSSAKSWESDIKKANKSLKEKIDNQNKTKPPIIHITPPIGIYTFFQINVITYTSNSQQL